MRSLRRVGGLGVLAIITIGAALWVAFRPTAAPPDLTPDPVPDRWALASDAEGVIPGGAGDWVGTKDQRVVRTGPGGEQRWATRLDGVLGGHRPPHAAADARRAYVSHAGGVTSLDVNTGAVLWQSPGPSDFLLLSGDLLLATDCSVGDHIDNGGRWVLARRATDGVEVFRVALPGPSFSPRSLTEMAGLFVAQGETWPDAATALLIDRAGQIHHRFNQLVVAITAVGADRLVLTDRGVVRVAGDGRALWTAPFEESEWLADGGLHLLPDGGVICYLYCEIADTGVLVTRLDPATGRVAWEVRCPRLGVSHSAYSHRAAVAVSGGHVKVTSRGSGGTFVEVLDARSGRSLGRRVGE